MGGRGGYSKLQDGAWGHAFDYGRHSLDVLSSVPVGRFDHLFAMLFEDVIGAGVVLLVPFLTVLPVRLRPPAVLVVYTVLSYLMVTGTQQYFGNVSRTTPPCEARHWTGRVRMTRGPDGVRPPTSRCPPAGRRR
ncbi:hypothetical protein [Streptomyces incanus]|uniref:Integral membrane protein n=1 Tax=Streptomyces incanus TaxID=887453 RepID=A0ABW0XRC2_9ACTN